ncbi:hypothetical protein [Gordonia sp. (in: high G+C Gram-positive bacteria)]|uniref:hypothetical protein n=1 Tax=Gordonia sp. (in: high G+C Gram-positive bacteria) TaxID=84139 RepID=UPI0016AC61BC|nr:hypothetical protein [Gordonia sp. (in: high G+C Gram-positive bacteria)]NLG47174.1 hypothetical protein [Gordonia sp. (in: high G+C Gram-positive bacteria)]
MNNQSHSTLPADPPDLHTHCTQCGASVQFPHGSVASSGPVTSELVEQIALFNERSAAREEVVRDLSESLSAAQDLLTRRTAMPLIRRLQRLHDDLSYDARTAADPAVGARLSTYAVEVEDLLTAESVVIGAADEGEPFDPRRHTTVGRMPTADPALDRTVAQVLGHLYSDSTTGDVTGLARVKVYQYTPTPTQEDQQ